ncbi:MAG: sugar ABC transporter substrate-binding protein [Chloroflexi bacterium]|nr:sugar ABC transporter substrate-binding protein [Anaerolineaceae bacterium]NLI44353.1 sugar ABC transporter substrate-binding protein [Chloroflexota bacterium]HOE34389.1 sugar ABC transporter substrate-binding protein [Anaerolineaceae bacterium]HOT25398.1 sugar ABC transporter substrate-binding protein [Anaerolineaceae bacterium]HQH57384.1 sugar ABC transporter substrate-binding protein [Anaerolineaceae bacterium]
MKHKFIITFSLLLIAALLISGCAAKATEAPAAATEEPAEDTEVTMIPAKPGAPFDIKGKKVCYIIPSLANPFLNGVATSVTEQFKADGVEVLVYGADEGGLNQQFDQIENCISMKVDFMYVMAAGEIDQLLPAVEQVKAAGIPVMGVPPQKLAPFDAIMHTSQYEDGQKVAKMACDFIEAVYPEAANGTVETAIIGAPSSNVGMKLRDQGYSTITDICPKVKLVAHLDITGDSIPVGQAAAENVLTANPNVKVFIAQSTAHAQGIANAIKALPNVDLAKYGVFAGDMDPSMIPTVTSCQDPYKGFVAIGGTALDVATYEQIKKMLQGVEYPNIINDALEPIHCDFSTLK